METNHYPWPIENVKKTYEILEEFRHNSSLLPDKCHFKRIDRRGRIQLGYITLADAMRNKHHIHSIESGTVEEYTGIETMIQAGWVVI